MSDETFADVLAQAVDMGFEHIGLTPMTGDVFMDKSFERKLDILDESPMATYHFFTNFVLPSHDVIDRLMKRTKLSVLTISIYGHDLDSFCAVTRKGAHQYQQLTSNLKHLAGRVTDASPEVILAFRTARGVDEHFELRGTPIRSDLVDAVRALTPFGRVHLEFARSFDNWGGKISADDTAGLGIHLVPERMVPKEGLCSMLVSCVQVTADGQVNACAHRGVESSLIIGDLADRPLAEIVSLKNVRYRDLFEAHQANRYPEVCRSCTFYRSAYRAAQAGDISLDEAVARLST